MVRSSIVRGLLKFGSDPWFTVSTTLGVSFFQLFLELRQRSLNLTIVWIVVVRKVVRKRDCIESLVLQTRRAESVGRFEEIYLSFVWWNIKYVNRHICNITVLRELVKPDTRRVTDLVEIIDSQTVLTLELSSDLLLIRSSTAVIADQPSPQRRSHLEKYRTIAYSRREGVSYTLREMKQQGASEYACAFTRPEIKKTRRN